MNPHKISALARFFLGHFDIWPLTLLFEPLDSIHTSGVASLFSLGVFALIKHLILGGLADDAVMVFLDVGLLIRRKDEFLARLLVMMNGAVVGALCLVWAGVGCPLALEGAQAAMANGHCGIGGAGGVGILGGGGDGHGAKETGEHPGEDHAAHGQASADDGDVDFDHGPESRGNVV